MTTAVFILTSNNKTPKSLRSHSSVHMLRRPNNGGLFTVGIGVLIDPEVSILMRVSKVSILRCVLCPSDFVYLTKNNAYNMHWMLWISCSSDSEPSMIWTHANAARQNQSITEIVHSLQCIQTGLRAFPQSRKRSCFWERQPRTMLMRGHKIIYICLSYFTMTKQI